MATTGSEKNREHWLSRAREVSRRVNVAWWLEVMTAPLLVCGLLGSAALLVVRRHYPDTEGWVVPVALGAGVGVLFLVTWWLASRRFERPEQSLVRIEAAMRLRNALSAAEAGVGPWPEPVGSASRSATGDAGLRWNWPRLVIPPLGALALLAAGWLIPVSSGTAGPKGPAEQPQAWQQLESQLDHLAKEEVVDEKYLEEMRKKLDELKEQKEEDWFSHSSLEATDSLKEGHKSEMQRMERELGRAEKALGALEKNAGGMAPEERARQLNEFEQALQGLQNGAMKPNPQLLDQLKQLDPKNLGQLTPEQMQQLKENLQKHGDAMKQPGHGEGGGDWEDELQGEDGDGEGEGQGGGEGEGDGEGDGEGPGRGGIDRGPGHDPSVLGKERDAVETGDLTGLEAKDLSRSMPGDLLQLQDGEHEAAKDPSEAGAGGDAKETGSGGDRVWREALDPEEQKALKRFYE
jgi:hypothetical protein